MAVLSVGPWEMLPMHCGQYNSTTKPAYCEINILISWAKNVAPCLQHSSVEASR